MSVTVTPRATFKSIVVASEPLDDSPGWRPVEPGTLVTANRHGLRLQPLRLEQFTTVATQEEV